MEPGVAPDGGRAAASAPQGSSDTAGGASSDVPAAQAAGADAGSFLLQLTQLLQSRKSQADELRVFIVEDATFQQNYIKALFAVTPHTPRPLHDRTPPPPHHHRPRPASPLPKSASWSQAANEANKLSGCGIGYSCTIVSTFSGLFELLRADDKWDLGLLDVYIDKDAHTDELNGDEVLPSVRLKLPNTPLIMFSASSHSQLVERCILNGADGFIPKPLKLETVRLLWQHTLQKSIAVAERAPGADRWRRPVAERAMQERQGGPTPADAPSAELCRALEQRLETVSAQATRNREEVYELATSHMPPGVWQGGPMQPGAMGAPAVCKPQ